MNSKILGDERLDKLQRDTFGYFLEETNPRNGLVPDSTREGAPSSIAAVGFALAAYAVGAERGFLTRAEAIRRVLATLRFFWESPQGEDRDATGYKGFFYHFLDMQFGRRAWESELSMIDTTFLLAGALAAAAYFDREARDEREISKLADALYRRVDWQWAQNGSLTVAHGWKPESGFLRFRWEGYSEAILLYVLGLGSPTHALPETSYTAWTRTYRWKKLYGQEFLYAGPLFIHQLSHVWIDFRGIRDDYIRQRGIDYFENSRRATIAQQQYAIRNPKAFKGYGEYCWGLTASDGPGPAIRRIDGLERRFYDYEARSIPYGPDGAGSAAVQEAALGSALESRASCRHRDNTRATRTPRAYAFGGSASSPPRWQSRTGNVRPRQPQGLESGLNARFLEVNRRGAAVLYIPIAWNPEST